jgi:hypothetical protein
MMARKFAIFSSELRMKAGHETRQGADKHFSTSFNETVLLKYYENEPSPEKTRSSGN